MDAAGRTADDHVSESLYNDSDNFSFFQIVQLLERFYKPATMVGQNGPASEEIIRFRPSTSLSFPASDVAKIDVLNKDESQSPRFRINTTFLGLYGSSTPLPLFYSEEILWADQENNPVRDFMDIFHHRLISLFYRCWLKYRYSAQFNESGNDEFTNRMLGLIGMGTKGLAENIGMPLLRMVRYAGILSGQQRPVSSLEGIISDYFDDIKIHIKQFTGKWFSIIREQRCSLGKKNTDLGMNCSLGEKVYGISGNFTIAIGPMDYGTFRSFLPSGERFKILCSIVRLFMRDMLDFSLELILLGSEIKPLQLLSNGENRLGWLSWLFSDKEKEMEDCSIVFDSNAATSP